MRGNGVYADSEFCAFRTNLPSCTNKRTTPASANGESWLDYGLNSTVHTP